MLAIYNMPINAQWVKINHPVGAQMVTLHSVNSTLIAGTSYKKVFFSDDFGDNWRQADMPGCNIMTMAFYGSNYLTGGFSGIYLTTNYGLSWSNVLNNYIIFRIGTNGSTIIAFGEPENFPDMFYLISTDNGITWQRKSPGIINCPLKFLTFGTNYYACSNNGVFLSLDNGDSWNLINEGMTNNAVNAMDSCSSGLLAGTNDGVYLSKNMGVYWNKISERITNVISLATKDSSIFAATSNKIFASSNNGKNWVSFDNGISTNNIKEITVCGNYVFAYSDDSTIWRRPISELTFIKNETKSEPNGFGLSQNYPNPFNSSTVISYMLPVSGHVTLKVYDALGKEVKTLVDKYNEAGRHQLQFDCNNLASGIYLYRLQSGNFVQSRKMIFSK